MDDRSAAEYEELADALVFLRSVLLVHSDIKDQAYLRARIANVERRMDAIEQKDLEMAYG